MTIELGTPDVHGLDGVSAVLREWQDDDSAFQLHPGDIGWYRRFGGEDTAGAVRTWRRDGRIVAIGLLDGADVLRFATAPDVRRDEELARAVADDLAAPDRGVVPAGAVDVEAPIDALLHEVLAENGWEPGDLWTPLRLDLAEAPERSGLRVVVADADLTSVRTEVHRAAFGGPGFTDERWHAMAEGPDYADARCLVGYDGDDAVAAITVWSAGPGRPGVIEPMGVHPDHRGKGHGTTITVAGATALRDLGSSSALVATPSSNVGAVATYEAAGFHRLPERQDSRRAG